MDIKFDQQTYDIYLVEVGDNFLDLDVTKYHSEDLMQRLFLRLKAYPKDLFWNINYGIDYLNTVFGKNRPRTTVDIIIKNEIMKEGMVDEITFFESEIFNYSYACKFTVSIKDEPTKETYYILTNELGVILTDDNGNTLTTRL